MDPPHMIFHVINSTEDPFAFDVRAWDAWLMLNAAASQRKCSGNTSLQRAPLTHAGLCLCVTRIHPPLIGDTPRGGRKEIWYDADNACANHNPW